MKIRKLLVHLLYALPFVFVFIGTFFRPNDPDLGWHLKYGQYFFNHFSVLKANTFATDMSAYQWINLSWGTDLLSYAIFAIGGFLGLSIAASLIVTFTFYFFSKAYELDFFEQVLIFPFLLFVENVLLEVSFRGQLISIFFLGLMTYIFSRYEKGEKRLLYSLPFLFLLWANIHGQFIIGLGVFGLWVLSYSMQIFFFEKDRPHFIQRAKAPILMLLLSFITTLINPFGIGLYIETARYIHNPLLFTIAEYLPPPQLSPVWWNHILTGFFVLIGMIIFIMNGSWKKKITLFSLFGVLYSLSFMVKRYSWSMYYFIIPFFKPVAAFLKPDKKIQIHILGGIIIGIGIIYVTSVRFPLTQYSDMSWDLFCEQYYGCSTKAAKILEDMNTGNLMNLYAWGGWLEWQHPKVIPSIDGRMHLWRDEKGFSAYKKYYDYEQNVTDVDDSSYQTAYVPNNKPVYNRLMELVIEGKWRLIFRDNNGAIFTRK